MTTLEKVAKAMFEAHQTSIYAEANKWEDAFDRIKSEWFVMARTAIEALKNLEPIEQFSTMLDELHCSGLLQLGAAHRGWNAMLDAILNEKES